jgi:hypothetical protein
MFFPRAKFPSGWRLLAVALPAALGGYALRGLADKAGHKPADTIPALVAHLEQRGLHLRVIAVVHDGDVRGGVFLTRTSKDWERLSRPRRAPDQLSRWQGTVQVQPEHNTWVRREARRSWGEGGLVYGQLLLFGDPDLLAQIRTALGE